ncbi:MULTISPECIES: hypothetical protein [Drancourtella]|nr:MULTISPECIES: hypothetical protein [Drancourtella]
MKGFERRNEKEPKKEPKEGSESYKRVAERRLACERRNKKL